MSYFFPEGGKFQFSSTFATNKVITAATNAVAAVFTSVAHGYTTGDEVLLRTGWEDATDLIVRIVVLTADTFSVPALNTTDAVFYAAGAGTGTASKVTSFIDIPQVLTLSPDGGGIRYGEIKPLYSRNGIKQAIGFDASGLTLGLGVDTALPGFIALRDLSRTLSRCAFRQVFLGGLTVYGYGNMSMSEQVKQEAGSPITVEVGISFTGRQIMY